MIRRPPRATRMTHSFPTRRSSDLGPRLARARKAKARGGSPARGPCSIGQLNLRLQRLRGGISAPSFKQRSEEHTSELQSLMRISYAVFCLKKKKRTNTFQSI